MNKSDDTISRQDAIDAIHGYFMDELEAEPTKIEDGYEVYADMQSCNKKLHDNKMLSRAIKALPSARPTGEWIEDRLISTSGGTYGVRRCSECESYYQDMGYGWNFCPNCGADMRGEDE